MRPLQIYQGEDKSLNIEMNVDISAATEVEFTIDTDPQISKTYSGGDITSITSSGFYVQMDASDTSSIDEGSYQFQGRATISGKLYQIRFTPNKLKIKDSVFHNNSSISDYGD